MKYVVSAQPRYFQLWTFYRPIATVNLLIERQRDSCSLLVWGAFVLKRYEDAVKAKDNIHAVIEGVGLSNDGGGKYNAPSVGGQVRAFEKAYEGLDKNVDYIECHATGTNVGDIIELDSVANFFKNEAAKPIIGALKPNMVTSLQRQE